jgi:hypothetical protein
MTLGNVANSTVDALKSSPLLLVVVVLNIGMITSLLYVAKSQQEERAILMGHLFDNCRDHKS